MSDNTNISKIIDEIDNLPITGPTVDEYFAARPYTEQERDAFALGLLEHLFVSGMLYKPIDVSKKQLLEQYKQTLK